MMKDKIDLFSRLSVYHEHVLQLAQAFTPIISFIAGNEIDRAKEQFTAVLKNEFVNHFTLEENVVFPAIRVWSRDKKLRRIIDEYLTVHEELLTNGNGIIMQLSVKENEFSKERAMEIVTALGNLNNLMVRHASDENEHIIPLLEHNPTLRFLSGRNMRAYHLDFPDSGIKTR
jgi:hypothetical protein